jgi:hypothetical protein
MPELAGVSGVSSISEVFLILTLVEGVGLGAGLAEGLAWGLKDFRVGGAIIELLIAETGPYDKANSSGSTL